MAKSTSSRLADQTDGKPLVMGPSPDGPQPVEKRALQTTNIAIFLGFVIFIGVALWLCLHPEILFVVFLIAFALGLVAAGLAGVSSSTPPRKIYPPATPPIRQPDTLAPLIVGLALGWWLGSGPGDRGGGEDC